MGFRRRKSEVTEAHAWRRFRTTNAGLLLRSGVPAIVCESHSYFIDLLENGHIHHHQDPLGFDVRQLSDDTKGRPC
jgi:hypothetical protein